LKTLRNLILSVKERTMTVLNLTDGLGLTEGGVTIFEEIYAKEQ
jgi:3-polyprenyl-4-hydroxybenzoate decarboxylase